MIEVALFLCVFVAGLAIGALAMHERARRVPTAHVGPESATPVTRTLGRPCVVCGKPVVGDRYHTGVYLHPQCKASYTG